MPADPGRRIAVAYITRAKGVRGHVRAEVLTHSPERFDALSSVVLEKEGRPDRALVLERWTLERPGVLLKFAGIDTPEEAREILVGGYITVAPGEVPELPEHTYYVYELVGCSVLTEDGQELGQIAEVLEMPSTDVYVVRGSGGEMLVPAVADFVVEVDLDERRVVVRGLDEFLPAP